MATTVALPFNSRSKQWHSNQSSPGFCSTHPDSSTSLRSSMARSPMDGESMGSQVTQKPRLPSFSNFLSGAGRPDLNFATPSSGSNRNDPRQPPLNQPNHNRSLGHHIPPQSTYGAPDPNIAQHMEQVSRRLSIQQSPVQPSFWPHSSPGSLERHPPLPPHLSQISPPEHGYGRLVVGERTIPGKGVCYIYDDGTMCQKIINGDAVNPKWGTTKAGKPRKRLGQACNTCREKKIKCDPSVPKCAQCQKFGRECKFESTNRTGVKQSMYGQSPPSTNPSEHLLQGRSPRRGSTASTEPSLNDQSISKHSAKSSMPVESLLSPASMDDSAQDEAADALPPTKKARFSASPRPLSDGHPSDCVVNESLPGSITSPASVANFSWKVDPYKLDRELTVYLLSKYFAHIGCTTDCTIPRKPFTHWVTTSSSKSSADLMLIYAMLAMGALFSRRRDLQPHYLAFNGVVQEAVLKNGDCFSLQLVHTRLILALIAFSQGQFNRALEYSGSARITSCGLNYNMEEGVCAITSPDELVFGFDRAMTIECRRRTFWTAFIMECFNGCCSPAIRAVYRSDCHLRLPCEQVPFEKGIIPLIAYDLDSHANSSRAATRSGSGGNVGLLGYMVEMATIFNEVVSRISRSKTQSVEGYNGLLKAFCHNIMARLETWERSITKSVSGAEGDTEINTQEPVSGPLILYHYTAMLLYRHVRHANMDQQTVVVHIREAYRHAQSILENVQLVSNEERKDAPMVKLALTSPVTGFAIIAALDTITAAGTLYDLMDGGGRVMSSVSIGLEALERLTDYWHSARLQREVTKERLKVLLNATKRASDFNGAYYFGEPMHSLFGPELDVVYGCTRMRYFQALGWVDRIHSDGDFHQLDGQQAAAAAAAAISATT